MRGVLIRSKVLFGRAGLLAAIAAFVFAACTAGADVATRHPTSSEVESVSSDEDVLSAASHEAVVSAASHEDVLSAASDEDALIESIGEGRSDPLEWLNRVFFWINRGIEVAVRDPVSQIYGMVVPDPAKRAVRRAFTNLNSAGVFANDVMQCEGEDAMATALRFAINSTVGLAGLFDLASELGLARHESDFGETLWRHGVPDGHTCSPVLGPANARCDQAHNRRQCGRVRLLGPIERIAIDADGLTLRGSPRRTERLPRRRRLLPRPQRIRDARRALRRRSEVSARRAARSRTAS